MNYPSLEQGGETNTS